MIIPRMAMKAMHGRRKGVLPRRWLTGAALVATALIATLVVVLLPGHGAVTDRAMLIATRDMMISVRNRVAELAFQGKTADEAVAAKPTGDYDKYVPGGSPDNAARFVRQIYAEIAAEGRR